MESSGLMTCPCHGSVYAIDGRRVSGLAPTALTKYTTSFDGADLVKVNIPNLGYSVTVAGVQPVTPEMQRLQLTFRSFRNVEYEVQVSRLVGRSALARFVCHDRGRAGRSDLHFHTDSGEHEFICRFQLARRILFRGHSGERGLVGCFAAESQSKSAISWIERPVGHQHEMIEDRFLGPAIHGQSFLRTSNRRSIALYLFLPSWSAPSKNPRFPGSVTLFPGSWKCSLRLFAGQNPAIATAPSLM